MKKLHKIYYEVDYIPNKTAIEISHMMSKLDLGIDEIFITDEFIIITTTKITKKYIEKMKKALWEAIIYAGGKPIKITYKYVHTSQL